VERYEGAVARFAGGESYGRGKHLAPLFQQERPPDSIKNPTRSTGSVFSLSAAGKTVTSILPISIFCPR
jgi:hypothetical protein